MILQWTYRMWDCIKVCGLLACLVWFALGPNPSKRTIISQPKTLQDGAIITAIKLRRTNSRIKIQVQYWSFLGSKVQGVYNTMLRIVFSHLPWKASLTWGVLGATRPGKRDSACISIPLLANDPPISAGWQILIHIWAFPAGPKPSKAPMPARLSRPWHRTWEGLWSAASTAFSDIREIHITPMISRLLGQLHLVC